jgi:ribulose-bisphosphate carboxylase large chain
MKAVSRLTRIVGLDQLHVGTAVGKMFESKKEVLDNCDALKENMFGLKQVMPVASGGLNPLNIPDLIKIFGNDVIMQFGGGVHGNPLGSKSGAMAVRQSLDATMKKIPLNEYAKKHKELKAAFEKWG